MRTVRRLTLQRAAGWDLELSIHPVPGEAGPARQSQMLSGALLIRLGGKSCGILHPKTEFLCC